MEAIVGSQIAMEAIVGSQIAMEAIVDSQIWMEAIVGSQIWMEAIVGSQIAMEAMFNSLTAKTAMFGKDIVTTAIANNQSAIDWLIANKGVQGSIINTGIIAIGKCLLLQKWQQYDHPSYTFAYGTRVGTVGNTSNVMLHKDKINNVMMCEPLTVTRLGNEAYGANYAIYVPMQ